MKDILTAQPSNAAVERSTQSVGRDIFSMTAAPSNAEGRLADFVALAKKLQMSAIV
jgi:hypothetical protein